MSFEINANRRHLKGVKEDVNISMAVAGSSSAKLITVGLNISGKCIIVLVTKSVIDNGNVSAALIMSLPFIAVLNRSAE